MRARKKTSKVVAEKPPMCVTGMPCVYDSRLGGDCLNRCGSQLFRGKYIPAPRRQTRRHSTSDRVLEMRAIQADTKETSR
jgi:hypothetical protein